MIKQRLVFFGLHLACSFAVIGLVIGAIVYYFYPGKLAQLENVWQAISILIPTDIILGPLLGTLVYKKNKQVFRKDLIIIALLQLAALSYGVFVLYNERPGYLVFQYDTFTSYPASTDQSMIKDPNLKVRFWQRPKVVALNLPQHQKNQTAILNNYAKGIKTTDLKQYWVKFSDYIKTHDIADKAINTEDIKGLTFYCIAGGKLNTIAVSLSPFTINAVVN